MFQLKIIGLVAGVLAVILSAGLGTKQPSPDQSGEALAKKYCSGCHQFPEPQILTKKSWNYLLTDMGFRLGIVDYSYLKSSSPLVYFNLTNKQNILTTGGLIPEQPLLSSEEWRFVRKYYEENAPTKPVPQAKKPKIKSKLKHFKLRKPVYQPPASIITMIRIDESKGRIIIGDQSIKSLTFLNSDLNIEESRPGFDLIVDEHIMNDSIFLLSIGDLMGTNIGNPKGYLILTNTTSPESSKDDIILKKLHRPADMEFADLDGDGIEELIICNFGDITGNVALYKQEGAKYKLSQELVNRPGAVRSQVHDFNNDGRPDIAVLMGDALENVSLFINKGKNNFERKTVINTHSAYGHTYFELQDFNNDGFMDILTANGDSDADPFSTLKNYHGVRIYLNDKDNNFNESYFYPMYGAHFAKAADFDQDGDLDIAASSFFPDFKQSEREQFVYLENKGNLEFIPYTYPETHNGRWMTMDIGDYDLDGDVDIVLGAGYVSLGMEVEYPQLFQEMQANGKAILVFENTIR